MPSPVRASVSEQAHRVSARSRRTSQQQRVESTARYVRDWLRSVRERRRLERGLAQGLGERHSLRRSCLGRRWRPTELAVCIQASTPKLLVLLLVLSLIIASTDHHREAVSCTNDHVLECECVALARCRERQRREQTMLRVRVIAPREHACSIDGTRWRDLHINGARTGHCSSMPSTPYRLEQPASDGHSSESNTHRCCS